MGNIDNVRKVMERVVNNNKILNTFANLQSRWNHEKHYEDWKEYENVIKKSLKYKDIQFVRGTKKPFGCVIIIDTYKIWLFLEKKENTVGLVATSYNH